MTLLDLIFALAGVLAGAFGLTSWVIIAVCVLIAIIVSRWLLGERIPRRPT